MSPDSPGGYHLLFVLTGSFGELFNAMYLVMGCGFRVTFALPDSLFWLNHGSLPGRCHRYETLEDLHRILETERPDVLFLFSGYLWTKSNVLDFDGLDRLLDQAKLLGVKPATSDPFLGLTARMPIFDPRNPIEQLLTMPLRIAGQLAFGPMFGELSRATSSLRYVPHVYVVDPAESGNIPRLAFFNPYIRGFVPGENPIPGRRMKPAVHRGEGCWLFILAASDYGEWVQQEGIAAAHQGIAARLRETLHENRQPVLIAPKACVEALSADSSLSAATLLDTCDYNHYMSLLLGAEYAFYWNIFSASILGRLLNCAPVFFLGQGHLAAANKQLFDAGMDRYYGNAPLPVLEASQRLTARGLAAESARQEPDLFRRFLQNVSRLPAPPEMVRQILAS